VTRRVSVRDTASFDTELVQAVTQRAETDAEELGRLRTIPARLVEGLEDALALDVVEIGL